MYPDKYATCERSASNLAAFKAELVRWACRIFCGSNNIEATKAAALQFANYKNLRDYFFSTEEYQYSSAHIVRDHDRDYKMELMLWGYRIFLEREPESEQVLQRDFVTLGDLRNLFLLSAEYQAMQGLSAQRDIILPAPFKLMSSLEQLDDFIAKYLNGQYAPMSAAEYLDSHLLDYVAILKAFGQPRPVADPFSREYYNWVMSFYRFIAGRAYDVGNEGLHISQEDWPDEIPLAADSVDKKSQLLRSYADFLSVMSPKAGQRVLELGCGNGNIADFLECCGWDYHAIDASAYHVGITQKRLFSQRLKNQIYQMSFLDIGQLMGRFDIIIFEASFHHCAEHSQLLALLHEKTNDAAKIYFLNEPIARYRHEQWGLNTTGEGLLQIRGRGWLELIFNEEYFLELLGRSGWEFERIHTLGDGRIAWEAKKGPIK